MALTKEDLQALRALMQEETAPIHARLDGMDKRLDTMQANIALIKEDIEEIKEHTTVTRDVVNGVSEWTEIASDVLRIKYPLPAKE